jgi:hypothetical protein
MTIAFEYFRSQFFSFSMESSLILQEKSVNINKTKLNIDFCQLILKFGSVCFIISQVNDWFLFYEIFLLYF